MSDTPREPDAEAIRAALEALCCPWCKKGPFKVPAQHISQMHGVNRWELRDLAEICYGTSICDPELAEVMREHGRERFREGSFVPQGPHQRRLSVAARKLAQEKGRLVAARFETDNELRDVLLRAAQVAGRNRRKPRKACAICGGYIPDVTSSGGRTKSKRTVCDAPACISAVRAQAARVANENSRRERFTPQQLNLRSHVLLMRDDQGLSFREIATKLGVSETSARNYYRVAKGGSR